MRCDCNRSGDRGFAAVDALVALTIVATTIALALQAFATAGRVASSAFETARATAKLRWLLDGAPPVIGTRTGRDGAFGWRTDMWRLPNAVPGPLLCVRVARVTAIHTGRRYQLGTLVFCRPPEPKS